MAKIKFTELVQPGGILGEVLASVSPRYNGENTAELLGLTEKQFEKLEKELTAAHLSKVEQNFEAALLNGDSIDFKNNVHIQVYTSTGYKNPDGSARRRLKATTRKAMLDKLNNTGK